MAVNPKRIKYRLLSWSRLFLAFGVLTLFLCVYVWPLQKWSGIRAVLANTQFTGALMRKDVLCLVAIAIMAVAALAGRWYCSVLCPFGTLQEAVWRIGQMVGRRKARFISPWSFRYVVPVLAGIGIATANYFPLMDPISNFGRGVRSAYILAAEGVTSMTSVMWVMLGVFVFVLVLAVARGRRFCDWCPVGVLLGAFTYIAPLGVRLKKEVCVSCGKCELLCPVSCIDSKERILEDSRCVLCLSCTASCPTGALEYGYTVPVSKVERRAFLRKSSHVFAWLASAVYLGGRAMRTVFPGLAKRSGISGSIPVIMPPGAQDAYWYRANCIGCLACVAACPVKIVRVDKGLHPRLDYTVNYCQYNCTECSNVCPTQALRPLGEMKQRTRVGLAALDRSKCVVITKGEACGACAEVCATRALQMEPLSPGSPAKADGGLTAPVLDSEYCIGCGGCHHVCPAEPRAIEVTGVTPQVLTPGMRPFATEENVRNNTFWDEFPF